MSTKVHELTIVVRRQAGTNYFSFSVTEKGRRTPTLRGGDRVMANVGRSIDTIILGPKLDAEREAERQRRELKS